mgnify:CR=1 FL=1
MSLKYRYLQFGLLLLSIGCGCALIIGCADDAEQKQELAIDSVEDENPTEQPEVETSAGPIVAEKTPDEVNHNQPTNPGVLYDGWENPVFVLVFTGRQYGYIEPCGCTGLDRQKGGLARRHTFLQGLRERDWQVVSIDAGNQVRRFGRQPELKFNLTSELLSKMEYQAVGIGPADLKLPAGELFAVAAVNDVSFQINRGECFGLVGESGSGKTSVSKLVMRGITPDEGKIVFNDCGTPIDIFKLKGDEMLAFRRKVQMVFQDPFGSLNPRMTVFDVIREPLIIHEMGDVARQREIVQELMRLVGLDPRFLSRYPHSFSGGQRQRIGIARALALKPDLLICDEPVSALDVSIQAQILNLFKDMQEELGLTYLFISHNLAVVDYVADRIAVMCRGQIVEIAPREALFKNPVHHYTRSLMAAVPYPNLDRKLDFDSFGSGGISDPSAWPKPFAFQDSNSVRMHDLGDDHFVLAEADVSMENYR